MAYTTHTSSNMQKRVNASAPTGAPSSSSSSSTSSTGALNSGTGAPLSEKSRKKAEKRAAAAKAEAERQQQLSPTAKQNLMDRFDLPTVIDGDEQLEPVFTSAQAKQQQQQQLQQQKDSQALMRMMEGMMARMEQLEGQLQQSRLPLIDPPAAAGAQSPAPSAQEEPAAASSSSSAASSTEQILAALARKMSEPTRASEPIVQVAAITYIDASEPRKLEAWIFSMEQLFASMRYGDHAAHDTDRLRAAGARMDRDLSLWLQSQSEVAAEEGEPIDSWKTLVAALRAQFVDDSVRRKAMNDLLNCAQHAGETMPAYLGRAQLLRLHAPELEESAVVRIVMGRVRKDEFRFTYAKVMKEVELKSVVNFAQLRKRLTEEALAEPKDYRKPLNPSLAARAAAEVRKAAAAAMRPPDADQPGSDDELTFEGEVPFQVAAVGTGCARCGSKDHWVAKCPKPDTRVCHWCQKTGHIIKNCAEKAAGKVKTAAKPKN